MRLSSDPATMDFESAYTSGMWRRVLVIAVLAGVLAFVAGVALTINGLGLSVTESYRYVIGHILGQEYEFRSEAWRTDYLLWNIYLPRVVLGTVAGAGLAVCGVVMQSLMNNPLADPYTVGISDGACFGAVAAIVAGFSLASLSQSMGVVVSAFVCGLIPAVIIIVLSRIVRLTPATSILIGVSLSYLFSGLETMIMVSTDTETLQSAYLWQIGTLNGATWEDCVYPLAITVVCSMFMMLSARSLNLLSLGDDTATSLGLNVDQFRMVCMILTSVCIAAIVSFCGVIGFVGLVAPHIVRILIGGDNRFLIPASMVCGSLFILVADLIARTIIAPEELRVGVIVSVIGAPFFLYVILRRKRNYGEAFRCRTSRPDSRRDILATSAGSGFTWQYCSWPRRCWLSSLCF